MLPPRVFISYSHDSEGHMAQVYAFSEQLRRDGVDAWIDQYEPDPDVGWPIWIRRQIKRADKVLLVFTENYEKRFVGEEKVGIGSGATFEGAIVTQVLYDSGASNTKFRAVVLTRDDAKFVPVELRRFTWYCTDSTENYLKLLRWLKGSPAIVPSPIGEGPILVPTEAPGFFREEIEVVEPAKAEPVKRDGVAGESLEPDHRRYRAIFLGTFGGYQTIATGINESNQLVGYGQLEGTAEQHAFLYRGEQLVDLSLEEASNGWARAINEKGQIAGYISTPESVYAFCYIDGRIINIGTLFDRADRSFGSDINNSGVIVGYTCSANRTFWPFIYREGYVERLTSIDSQAAAILGVNDQEQMVGFTYAAPGRHTAFCYENGKIRDLGEIVGTQSQALNINNQGQVIGFTERADGISKAFFFDGDKMIDFGVSGRSMALGINDAGEVVGEDVKSGDTSAFAFLWRREVGLIDLNTCVENLSDGATPGFTRIFSANDINELGNIAASGNYFDGTKTVQAGCLLMRI